MYVFRRCLPEEKLEVMRKKNEKKENENNEHDIYPLIASVSTCMNNSIQTIRL